VAQGRLWTRNWFPPLRVKQVHRPCQSTRTRHDHFTISSPNSPFLKGYAQHPDWQVRGTDLMGHLALAPWEAVLGATVPVKTLEGSVSVKVPAGFQQGNKLRVRGKGLPAGGARRGDLYVEASIQVPPRINKEDELLWKQLAARATFNPRKAV